MATIALVVPPVAAADDASPARELGALRRPVVLLTLGVGAVGFGGFFAVYSYISPTLTTVSGFSVAAVPAALALFGLGMTVGTEIGGRLADRTVVGTIYAGMAAAGAMLLLFTVTAHHPVTAGISIFGIAASGSLCLPALQTRLMDVAGDAQSLAAAGNHAALNIGNALGAFLGGVVLAAGYGYTSPAAVGAGLAAAGLVVLALSRRVERTTTGPALVP